MDSIDVLAELLDYLDSLESAGTIINTDTITHFYVFLMLQDETMYRWQVDVNDPDFIVSSLQDLYGLGELPENFVLSENGRAATIKIDNNNLFKEIEFPPLPDGCTYFLIVNDSSNFFDINDIRHKLYSLIERFWRTLQADFLEGSLYED